jgi:hypothetical protein
MMWSGFEPFEGEINETYSDTIKEIVDGLGSRGVYSYLDMHQVVFLSTALKSLPLFSYPTLYSVPVHIVHTITKTEYDPAYRL